MATLPALGAKYSNKFVISVGPAETPQQPNVFEVTGLNEQGQLGLYRAPLPGDVDNGPMWIYPDFLESNFDPIP